MKICTITCHDVYNYGASLQAYALMTYLEICKNDVEIIDYKPDYLSNHYSFLAIANPRWESNYLTKSIYILLKAPERIFGLRRKRSFDIFKEKHLKITKEKYKSNEDIKENLPFADAFICGSDQIWNSLHQNGRDKAFYLDFVPNHKIKASYAASFATDFLADEYKSMVKDLVTKLDGIGVREISGVRILEELGIDNSVTVVDPVFLLSKEHWDKIATRNFKEKYLLVYDFDKSELIEKVAVDIAKETGYKIYTLSNFNSMYENRSFRYEGPETFVSLVKNAEFVISNSFHAVVFSVIYEKKIAVINRTEAINTRMRDLLQGLNMEDRLVKENNYNISNLLEDIDYKNVKKLLNNKIDFSKKYLEEVLLVKINRSNINIDNN